MAKATAQDCNRRRESPVAENSTVESAPSPERRSGQRRNAVNDKPAIESPSPSLGRTRQRKTAVDEEVKVEPSPSSSGLTGKKGQGASETVNDFLEVASGIVAFDGRSPSRKKVKALSPRGANKFEEDVKILDLEPEIKEETKDNVVRDEPVENSSGKKKGSSAKEPAKPEKDEESVCKFIGNPVPHDEAQRRWPERYTDKIPSSVPLLRVKKLSPHAILPTRASHLSAGYDLSSASEAKVKARSKALVPTDLSIAIPEGTYARIAPRSGLAWKHSIDVGAGVIDADYRGPISVVLFNHSDADFDVKPGDRIAQMIIEKIMFPQVIEIDDLDSTVRGAGGFGSTGV